MHIFDHKQPKINIEVILNFPFLTRLYWLLILPFAKKNDRVVRWKKTKNGFHHNEVKL